jgi:hypothetical protein
MPEDKNAVGLCADCLHCRIVQTTRSSFYLCQRSFVDERFPKYPRLPVIECLGYEPVAHEQEPPPQDF